MCTCVCVAKNALRSSWCCGEFSFIPALKFEKEGGGGGGGAF